MATVLTIPQVARACQVAPRTVTKWIQEGHLKGYMLPGGHRRVTLVELDKFVKRHGMPKAFVEEAATMKPRLVAG